MKNKPLIHFAHANGVPSKVYKKIFHQLQNDFDIINVPLIGPDKRYPITNNWVHLVDQVVDSIVRQAEGRKVIGLGHSLGSVLTFMASYKRPELFERVIMMDPPLIVGKQSFAFQLVKTFKPKMVDKMTPAGLSVKRRDHWESRQQAYELLRPKGFYQHFDEECFQAYIDYALTEDHVNGGVTLTIPKADEVKIFRTNPSHWWLPMPNPPVSTELIVGNSSPFYQRGFPQLTQKKFGIPYTVTEGGHMFPLEYPDALVDLLKEKLVSV
ncbi:alpha/beta hydrolase [Acinetobacter stercoris]|uniref:Alpha/beta hydrolase family protein n=1 Tax=Acinetobacter stercoris TaxID=2126983 RepID=A0A2U3MZZ2_9GAMM|nr:alpha/beta hydrolase [Acinetobacter stercoris]SPL70943.1 Alpha/beta hydrolase family protein [Acinetobacter stercoris]